MKCDRCQRDVITEYDHAVRMQGKDLRILMLELALQEYMDIMRYAEKEALIQAIKNADAKARLLIPKRVGPTVDGSRI